MMTSEELRESFIHVLKGEFPEVKYKTSTLKWGGSRISPFVPNNKRNKRWMQLDANPQYLSIAMDHAIGDIKRQDVDHLNLDYGLNGRSSAIELQKNDDAVNISIFCNEPYDFSNEMFIAFLHKHYQSYLKLMRS